MEQIKIRCRGVIMHEGKLLVVRHSHGLQFFAFPGGHLDFGEDPQECMRRELIEELGIEPKVGRLLYVHTFLGGSGDQSVEFFFEIENGADYLLHAEKEKTHADEIAEVVWVQPENDLVLLPKVLCTAFKEGALFDEGVRFVKE